jgi:1,4-alpha-glucan branching enzyme
MLDFGKGGILMSIGSFVLVLHSHLPYCRKAGVWPFGEEWVFEAMAETYIPLLDIVDYLVDRNALGSFTVGFTPVLLDQLSDPYMLLRFDEYLEAKIAAAETDIARFGSESEWKLQELARFYRDRYEGVRSSYHRRHNGNLVDAFRALQDNGVIEILAGAATHAYLPLLATDSSVYSQLKLGHDVYSQNFGRPPSGIWLPECGYSPPSESSGVDRTLKDLGYSCFFVDAHAIEGGASIDVYSDRVLQKPQARATAAKRDYTTYLPYLVSGSDTAVLGRNQRTALQVWSSEWGYPGDGNYREFHRRDPISGFSYWKVTSRLVDISAKETYHPEAALMRAKEHADHFVEMVERLLLDFNGETGKQGVIVAPFDVELFGHWWMEGLDWLRWTLEGLSKSPHVEVLSASKFLEKHPPNEKIDLLESSWGLGGGHYIWDNDLTNWMWQEIHNTEKEMQDITLKIINKVRQQKDDASLRVRLLKQAAREALLLQSSDWPFLVTTEQARDYGERRFLEHKHRFERLAHALAQDVISPDTVSYLEQIESIDAVFPQIDFATFMGKQGFCGKC